jgi:hypothetical protein
LGRNPPRVGHSPQEVTSIKNELFCRSANFNLPTDLILKIEPQ